MKQEMLIFRPLVCLRRLTRRIRIRVESEKMSGKERREETRQSGEYGGGVRRRMTNERTLMVENEGELVK